MLFATPQATGIPHGHYDQACIKMPLILHMYAYHLPLHNQLPVFSIHVEFL